MPNAVQTLRPNTSNLIVTSGTTATIVGATTGHQAVADESDGSYVEYSLPAGGSTGTNAARFGLGTFALPALAQVRVLTMRYRDSSTNPVNIEPRIYDETDGTPTYPAAVTRYGGATAITDRVFSANATTALTQSDIDQMAAAVFNATPQGDAAVLYRLYRVALEVAYNRVPTATAPAASTVTTDRPTVSWTYADPDGDDQERYRVKTFSADQYNAAGFNPNTATPVWDSGTVSSASTSVRVGTALQNQVTYRHFISVGDVGSGDRMSAITASGPFQETFINTNPPATPTLDLFPTTQGNVRAVIGNPVETGRPAAQANYVERSLDGGQTWERLGPDVAPGTDFIDRFAPWDLTIQYRARATATVDGVVLTSLPSAVRTITLDATLYGWQLTDPLNAANDMRLDVLGEAFTLTASGDTAVFEPLGSQYPVVVSGTAKGERADLDLFFASKADADKFDRVRTSIGPKYLRMREGAFWVVFAGARKKAVPSFAKHRMMTVEVLEVAEP